MNWIKCSERQPSKSGSYLVTYKKEDGAYDVDYINYYANLPWNDKDGYDGWGTLNDVVAWNDEEIEPYKPMRYHSRRYIREKWEGLKWDVENALDIYNTVDDKITDEEISTVKREMRYYVDAIMKEVEKE